LASITGDHWKTAGNALVAAALSVTHPEPYSRGGRKSYPYILASALMLVNSPAGQPALELKRNMDTTYNTAFTFPAQNS
jgi:hypothetical protein